jgi:hypothetical protein
VRVRCIEEGIYVEIKRLSSRVKGGCRGLGGEKQKRKESMTDYIFRGAGSVPTTRREARVRICPFTQ